MSLKKSLLSLESLSGSPEMPMTPNQLVRLDTPGNGNAYHHYLIFNNVEKSPRRAEILFQKGSIKEVGPNGIFLEDLLGVCIDRLNCFQTSEFACLENEVALRYVKGAFNVLTNRTARRVEQGTEGTLERDQPVKRLLKVCRDDYDDGTAWYVLKYEDGSSEEFKREIPDDETYELLDALHGNVMEPELLWRAICKLTTPLPADTN